MKFFSVCIYVFLSTVASFAEENIKQTPFAKSQTDKSQDVLPTTDVPTAVPNAVASPTIGISSNVPLREINDETSQEPLAAGNKTASTTSTPQSTTVTTPSTSITTTTASTATTTNSSVTTASPSNSSSTTTTTTTMIPTSKSTPEPATTTTPGVTNVTSSSTSPVPVATTETTPTKDRRFDGPSFIGGIVLSLGTMAIGFVALKFYKAHGERNYHTL